MACRGTALPLPLQCHAWPVFESLIKSRDRNNATRKYLTSLQHHVVLCKPLDAEGPRRWSPLLLGPPDAAEYARGVVQTVRESVQTNAEAVSLRVPRPLPCKSFPIYHSLPSYDLCKYVLSTPQVTSNVLEDMVVGYDGL
jgi:hypothetical protein